MKIAIDISPISKRSKSAHKVRGVGMYINMLVDNLPRYDKKNEYVFVEDKAFPPDTDLIHYPYFDPFFLTLPLNSSKKFIVTVHDLTPLVFPKHFPAGLKGRAKWLIQKRLLQQAARIITDSDSSKKDVEKIVGINPSKVQTVYLAAEEQFKKLEIRNSKLEIVKKFSLPENFLLYVGDATWNKNLPRIVEAVKKTKYKMVLVGKIWNSKQSEVPINPWNNDLREVLKSIEGDEQFVPLGFVEDSDLVEIYNLASVLLMPSIYEGFGLPVLEAMSCGCPVICSRGGSLAEVGGEAVVYADEKDADNIASSIEKVTSSKSLQLDLSNRGMDQASKFSTKKMITDTIDCYQMV